MKLTVDYMNRLDKEIEENQKKRVEQEIERRKDPFYRFGTKAITGSLKMFMPLHINGYLPVLKLLYFKMFRQTSTEVQNKSAP